jgi:uncharacterized protein YndB with AHSA1/START domain
MEITSVPAAKTALLIRKPVAQVFEAFANADTITKFWFDRSSGRLDSGANVRWYWDAYKLSCHVRVVAFAENERIEFEWAGESEDATTVEWTFESRSDDSTFVSVTNKGFTGDGDKVMSAAIDSTSGFALVLAAAKAYLEYGIELNVVGG